MASPTFSSTMNAKRGWIHHVCPDYPVDVFHRIGSALFCSLLHLHPLGADLLLEQVRVTPVEGVSEAPNVPVRL